MELKPIFKLHHQEFHETHKVNVSAYFETLKPENEFKKAKFAQNANIQCKVCINICFARDHPMIVMAQLKLSKAHFTEISIFTLLGDE